MLQDSGNGVETNFGHNLWIEDIANNLELVVRNTKNILDDPSDIYSMNSKQELMKALTAAVVTVHTLSAIVTDWAVLTCRTMAHGDETICVRSVETDKLHCRTGRLIQCSAGFGLFHHWL